ncbi:MAG: fluoride efflux transporter FluC [Halodesulfurarchaeum sp.]
MIEPYLVGFGGMIGAVLRFAVSSRFETGPYPTVTVLVNVLGSFGLGLLTFLQVPEHLALLLGVGVCGSFTTFSSFSVSTVRLWESEAPIQAVGFAALNIAGALAAIGLAALLVWTL